MYSISIGDWHSGLGIMSGTSLDGIDIAFCGFQFSEDQWQYRIELAETISYPAEIKDLIEKMPGLDGASLIKADRQLGTFYGELASNFIDRHAIQPEFIASHGHTIFHQPAKQYTFQAGHGGCLAVAAGVPVICDFRSQDVALGGQGAPLVPIGDELLFGQFDALINLGGFANISLRENNERIAYDICPVNIVLNHFAQRAGYEYDKDGLLARQGMVIPKLLAELEQIDFYLKPPPKSLGREWVESRFHPIIQRYESESNNDILATLTQHMSDRIIQAVGSTKSILFTGGGTRNKHLIDLAGVHLGDRLIVPDSSLIDFKEALIFAFLGWLRINGLANTLPSATGANKPNCSGALFLP